MAVSAIAHGQVYKTSVGLRLGYPSAVSLKHFLNERVAAEVYAGTRGWYGYRYLNVSGALQLHKPLEFEGLENLQWYFGGGATVYFWTYDRTIYGGTYASSSIGLQGYLGLEYGLNEWDLPLSVSVDWVPTVYLGQYNFGFSRFGAGGGTLAIRYHLQ